MKSRTKSIDIDIRNIAVSAGRHLAKYGAKITYDHSTVSIAMPRRYIPDIEEFLRKFHVCYTVKNNRGQIIYTVRLAKP